MLSLASFQITASGLKQGNELAVSAWPFTHVGIFAGWDARGIPVVISNSRRRGFAAEETLDEFALGRPVFNRGNRGHLPGDAIVARAYALLGKPWSVGYNCEDFVAEASGELPTSPQREAWKRLLLVTGLFGIGAWRFRQQ